MKRRDLIKNLGALPLAGAFLPLNTPGAIIDRILEREAGPLVDHFSTYITYL